MYGLGVTYSQACTLAEAAASHGHVSLFMSLVSDRGDASPR